MNSILSGDFYFAKRKLTNFPCENENPLGKKFLKLALKLVFVLEIQTTTLFVLRNLVVK